jgi:hypothetical protein
MLLVHSSSQPASCVPNRLHTTNPHLLLLHPTQSQALLLAGPSAAAVKTNLRGVAPDLRNPAVREERFQQQLMETEAEMGYPRANTFLRSKDVTENFLTMQVGGQDRGVRNGVGEGLLCLDSSPGAPWWCLVSLQDHPKNMQVYVS